MGKITVAQKDAFFERLGETGNIRDACRHAGFNAESVYRLRRSDEDFARNLAEALQHGVEILQLELLRRALHGWTEPVFHQGVQCGEIVRYDHRLAIALLKALRPETYNDKQRVEHSGSLAIRSLLDSVAGVSRAGPAAD